MTSPAHCLLQELLRGRLRTTRRSSNRLLVEIVMFFAYRDTQIRRQDCDSLPFRARGRVCFLKIPSR